MNCRMLNFYGLNHIYLANNVYLCRKRFKEIIVMCKLDTIINTTVHDFHPSTVIKRGKSMEQIEYMTNILFALAKRLQRPLDKTLECIEKSHLLPILDKAYHCRKQKSSNDIENELTEKLLAV